MEKNHIKNCILGIDLGGTNTAFGIVSPEGRILYRGSIPTLGHPSFDDFIEALHKAVLNAMSEQGLVPDALKAIGVGAPCINSDNGVIEGAVNLPWESPLPLAAELSRKFGYIPVFGENDANVAALGEMYFGAAQGLADFIMLTLGTGVGGAVVCDGRLLHGKRGLAAELGHIRVKQGEKARKCNCGRRGCLDRYVSASGLVETVRELISHTDIPSSLRAAKEIDARQVGLAATQGDALAAEALRITGEILGEACADFTAFSSPEAFIFFGGVANSFPYLQKSMKEAYQKNLLWVYDGQAKFMKSTLPEGDAAILGAAAIAKNRCHI